jgi:hypothetical protein
VRLRAILASLAALVAFWAVWPIGWRYWADAVTSWGSHQTELQWFNPAWFLLWGVMFAITVVVGALASIAARPVRPLLFGLVVGLLCGSTAFLFGSHFFSDDSSMSSYVWTYGTYVLAPLGGAAGAAITAAVVAARAKPLPNKSLERTREG